MFKQLRIQLTLINLLTVGLVMILVLSGIYVVLQRNLAVQSERVMRFAAVPIDPSDHRQRPVPPEFQRHMAECFVAEKGDSEAQYAAESTYKPLEQKALARLTNLATSQTSPRGYLDFEGQQYHFLKDERSGRIVFLDRRFENELLNHLIGVYLLVGVVVMALLTVSSLFLADRALVPIRTSWERQKNFIADASHELRSPLAVIRSNLDVVMMNPEETVESQMRWLSNIQSESLRMSKMVQDLLLLARADAHQEPLKLVLCDIGSLVSLACDKMQAQGHEKGVEVQCWSEASLNAWGDEHHLQQLMMILLDNAVKYTASGGQVVLKAHRETGVTDRREHVVITVSDTGCGIAKEHLDKIFERFYRVDVARDRSTSENSTGLGLSIARWIVLTHKGTLQVNSEPGKGSVFTVHLPIGH